MTDQVRHAADLARILTAQRDVIRAMLTDRPNPDAHDRDKAAIDTVTAEPERAASVIRALAGSLIAFSDQRAHDLGQHPDTYLETILLGLIDAAQNGAK